MQNLNSNPNLKPNIASMQAYIQMMGQCDALVWYSLSIRAYTLHFRVNRSLLTLHTSRGLIKHFKSLDALLDDYCFIIGVDKKNIDMYSPKLELVK